MYAGKTLGYIQRRGSPCVRVMSSFVITDFIEESLHVLPVPAWVLSNFHPQSKDMRVRLIGHSIFPTGLHVSVNGCLFLYVGPVMNWRLVQGVSRPCPMSARISPTLDSSQTSHLSHHVSSQITYL